MLKAKIRRNGPGWDVEIDGPLVARAERRAADLGSLVRWFVAPASLNYLDMTDEPNATDNVREALKALDRACRDSMTPGRRLP